MKTTMIADAVQSTISVLSKEGEEHPALTASEARKLTDDINTQAEKLRHNLLRFFNGKGWQALGYESFREWADKEFRYGFQHAYKLVGVAEVEENISLIEGTDISVGINAGKQFKKLEAPALQAEAYRIAKEIAETTGEDEPTEKQAIEAVEIVKKRELIRESPHKVVAQMVANNELSAFDGERITKWLNLSPPQTQLYVQEKMAAGLRNLKILHKIVNRHKEFVLKGGASRNLQEIDATGRIGGVVFAEADFGDWKRMAAENQRQLLEEKKALKEAKERAAAKAAGVELPPKVEPKAMNAYTNSPEETLHELRNVLDDKTLDGLFDLMAKERGYVALSACVALYAEEKGTPITTDHFQFTYDIPRNGLECKKGDTVELLMRVKR
jgi:hypothetical protein